MSHYTVLASNLQVQSQKSAFSFILVGVSSAWAVPQYQIWGDPWIFVTGFEPPEADCPPLHGV